MLTVENISKSYGSAKVLDGVSLGVAPGSVHALLGANGAGKSTLMKCIAGAVAPDTGHIAIGGARLVSSDPQSAYRLGVASVFQHLSLVPTLTVGENIFLGAERTRLGVVQRRRQAAEATEVLETLGERIDPNQRVEELPPDTRQMVEIAKALAKSPKVLILDEPTAALSQSETSRLFAVVRDLRRTGIAIIYITHRIPEVFEIADAVTVMRDGRVVLQGRVDKMTTPQIIDAILGARPALQEHRPSEARDDDLALSVSDLDCGLVEPLSLRIHKGEMVGIYGLKGNGREAVVAGG